MFSPQQLLIHPWCTAVKGTTVADFYEKTARKYPSKPFIVFEGKDYTYAQIDDLANTIASWAASVGIVVREPHSRFSDNSLTRSLTRSERRCCCVVHGEPA